MTRKSDENFSVPELTSASLGTAKFRKASQFVFWYFRMSVSMNLVPSDDTVRVDEAKYVKTMRNGAEEA